MDELSSALAVASVRQGDRHGSFRSLLEVRPVELPEGESISGELRNMSYPEERLARVLPPNARHVLVVPDTLSYRRLARTQVGKGDSVLEIGSSLGECTHILTCHSAMTVGVDVVQELVEQCRGQHPKCRFEWLDCYEEPDRLRELCLELSKAGRLKVFVDIGGNRTAADVCRMLEELDVAFRDVERQDKDFSTPGLVVVKSRAVAEAGAKIAVAGGRILDPEAWWPAVSAPPAAGSSRQHKKKTSRARKAFWESNGTPEEWAAFEERRKRWASEERGALLEEARRSKVEKP